MLCAKFGSHAFWSRTAKSLKIANNYSKISFNFGPTLLQWMKHETPDVHRCHSVAADPSSRERFSGHGSAMAQAYNHMILPLANPRDKYTQVFLGRQGFRVSLRARPGRHVAAGNRRGPETLDTWPGWASNSPCSRPSRPAGFGLRMANGPMSAERASIRQRPIVSICRRDEYQGVLL